MPLHDISGQGGWQNYTPRVDQGVTTDISKTINSARYMVVGSMAFVHVALSMTGAGTAGSDIEVTLPLTSSIPSFTALQRGVGYYNDAGTVYRLTVYLSTTSRVSFLSNNVTVSSDLGNNPNFAIANGDTLGFSVAYEI